MIHAKKRRREGEERERRREGKEIKEMTDATQEGKKEEGGKR